MNYIITTTSLYSSLIPTLAAMSEARGFPNCERFELEDTILRAGGLYAWDIDNEAAALHTQVAAIIEAKRIADDAAKVIADAAAAELSANPPPWRVTKDTLIGRIPTDKIASVRAALTSQSEDDQFIWDNSAWFWSNNPRIRGLCGALGLDADALLARDNLMFI